MRVILDTCTFLWLLDDARELSRIAREMLTRSDSELYLSSVSSAEIAIKHALGKLTLDEDPRTYVPKWRVKHRIETLALDEGAALGLGRLPLLHKDPFDRLLICQAIAGGLTILTPDPLITQYAVSTIW